MEEAVFICSPGWFLSHELLLLTVSSV